MNRGNSMEQKSLSKEKINLLVTLDQGYIPQLIVLLTSIRINHPDGCFDLYLLHQSLNEEQLAPAAACCQKAGILFHPIRVDETLFENAPTNSRYPKEMYYRLLAPFLLPSHLEKVLYLDPDILVINPLYALWETDLSDYLFAAAAHTGKTELSNNVNRIRLKTDHDYYNSGVLLMNLKKGRDMIRREEIFAFVAEHGSELFLPDQDVLNALYGSEVLALDDAIWNYDARNYRNYLLRSGGVRDMKWVMQQTSILHFCGRAKPWKHGYKYRFGLLYQHYVQLTKRFLPDHKECISL